MKTGWIILAAIVVGAAAGTGYVFWSRRLPAPIQIPLLSRTPDTVFFRKEDQHLLRSWEMEGDPKTWVDKLKAELPDTDGWQPPIERSHQPEAWQIVRVRTPGGDFQFLRVVATKLDAKKVDVTIDEGPRQPQAFR